MTRWYPRAMRALALLPLVVVAACEAKPTATPTPAEPTATVSAIPIASSAPIDAGTATLEASVAPEASAPPVASALPWCDAAYSHTPCAFRAYGLCYERFKNCTNLPCTEAAPAPTKCPAGDAPAFMNKARACGRKATDPVVPQKTGWAATPPACDAILTTWSNVPTDDRSCKVDADCTDVVGSCFHATLNVTAKKKAAYAKTPCSAPGAGACPDGARPVKCESGCCVEQGGGFGDHAEVPFANAP